MTVAYKIIFTLSSLSNYFPIIPLLFLYNKLDKAFRIYLFILIIGSTNDLLGYAKRMLGFNFNYMIINDIYHIIDYGFFLFFFYITNNKKHSKRYFIIFFIGMIFQSIDWLFITKFKYNSIYANVFYFSVFCFLSLDKINFQIINAKKTNSKIDWLLIFYITILIYYSYALYTLSLYCLNIPLNIKIEPSLYNIFNIVNLFVNITLAIVLTKYFKNQRSSFLI
jgi:hypothetical protein